VFLTDQDNAEGGQREHATGSNRVQGEENEDKHQNACKDNAFIVDELTIPTL